jgi:kynurenine formamidase
MNIVDLTHTISQHMPVYPGTDPPVMTNGCTIEADGFWEKKMTLYSHTGTHMDAPAHMIKASKTLDQLSIDHFYGKAVLIDVSSNRNPIIDVEDLALHEEILMQNEFLLINTGWSHRWGTHEYFSGYPVLSVEAAKWLSHLNLKGIGVDAISVDEINSNRFPIHNILLKNDTVIIENLKNLDLIPVIAFIFSCFPLKFEEADGSPVRAVALF